jgi:hypothetical protein
LLERIHQSFIEFFNCAKSILTKDRTVRVVRSCLVTSGNLVTVERQLIASLQILWRRSQTFFLDADLCYGAGLFWVGRRWVLSPQMVRWVIKARGGMDGLVLRSFKRTERVDGMRI